MRGGGANNINAATDGALFFGSFLYILAVRQPFSGPRLSLVKKKQAHAVQYSET
jgi:hypothetical protein